MIKLLVGLGNPGSEYEDTRHNAGFWWIDAVARELKVSLVPERSYHGLVARTTVNGQNVWLLEPQTYMNLSGKSVSALARFFKIQPNEILVAHDELDIVPGEAKLKLGGSHAGHNGLRDIIAAIGTNEFNRVRIGMQVIFQGTLYYNAGVDGAVTAAGATAATPTATCCDAAPTRKKSTACRLNCSNCRPGLKKPGNAW